MMRGFGYGYGMMGNGWWDLLMILFWLLVLAGIVLLVIWAVRQLSGTGHGTAHKEFPGQTPIEDPCEIVRMRYARGEITKEQYEEMCRTLGT